MSLIITLTGQQTDAPASVATNLLRTIGKIEPELIRPDADGPTRMDLNTGIALATLVLTIPSAMLAGLEIKDRFDRRHVSELVQELKAKLEETDSQGMLETGCAVPIDLRRMGTDAIVDQLMQSLEEPTP